MTSGEALERLVNGNERFLRGEARFTGMRREVLADLARGQRPFATILGCSDSRVVPELIFDAVLGELFVVRVAGNVLSAEIAGSLQFAAAQLQTPLFVVLGHEGCGAVAAALASRLQGVQHQSRIQTLVDAILPAVANVVPHLPPERQMSGAVEANVRWSLHQIEESRELQERRLEGALPLVVGAIYDIESGRVRFLDGALGKAGSTSS
jgi:carbonic anhydrase